MGAELTLSRRALNRALLARQGLLERWDVPVTEAVERLVGLQAQASNPPYIGLAARLQEFRHADLSDLIERREVVRIAMMRSTIHLVTADDCVALRPVVEPAIGKELGRRWVTVDPERVAAWARPLVEAEPRTLNELGALAVDAFPDVDPGIVQRVVRARLPLVQIPPRGLWGKGGPAKLTTAEHWLGRPLAAATEPDDVVRRYLGAFGPATVADAQMWSGLTGLRPVFERLRPTLRTFTDEQGRELFDLPEAPRPDPETPAPPRLVAEFDNLILSHADRTRVIDEADRDHLASKNGMVPATVLVDGFVAGTWTARITRARGGGDATVDIGLFRRLRKADRVALTEEAERMLAVIAPDARRREVSWSSG